MKTLRPLEKTRPIGLVGEFINGYKTLEYSKELFEDPNYLFVPEHLAGKIV